MSLAITAASVENDNNDNNYNVNNYHTKDVIDNKRRQNNPNAKTQKYREPVFNMEKVKSVINSLHNSSSDDNELADYVPNSIPNTTSNTILGPTIEEFTPLDPLKPPESMRQVQKESTNYDSNVPQPIQNDDLNLQDLNAAFLNDAQVRDYYRKLAPGYPSEKNDKRNNSHTNQSNQPSQNRYSNMLETPATNDVLLNKLNYMINLLEEQQDERTNNVTEEVVLYSFLGVFIIFVVDSFARVGKYVR
jgi:hypothetical protein